MRNKLLHAHQRQELVKANQGRLPLAFPSCRANRSTTLIKSLTRMLKQLSLCAHSQNPESLKAAFVIMEVLFKIGKSARKSLLVEDLLEILSQMAMLQSDEQHRWVKIRAVYLTVLQEANLKTQVLQDVALMCAMLSPENELKSFVTSKYFTGDIRSVMLSFTANQSFVGETAKLPLPALNYLEKNSLIANSNRDQKSDNHEDLQNTMASLTIGDSQLTRLPIGPVVSMFSTYYLSKRSSLADSTTITNELLTVISKHLMQNDDIRLWRLLPKLNPNQELLMELVQTYQDYFLQAYIDSNLEQGCDLELMCNHINEMLEIIRDRLGYQDCQRLESTFNELQGLWLNSPEEEPNPFD